MDKDMKWEVLHSEYLFKRPWLTARKDTVKLPTGVVNDEYYVLEYPTWINVIARTKDGHFVFVRQYRHGLGETSYEIVAGVCEEGEEPLLAAQRELLEETGYSGGVWMELTVLSANTSAMNNLSHSFIAEGVELTDSQHLDLTEDIEVHLLTREQVLDMLMCDAIKQSLMAAPLWKCFYTEKK